MTKTVLSKIKIECEMYEKYPKQNSDADAEKPKTKH